MGDDEEAGVGGEHFGKHGQDNVLTLYDTKWENA